MHGLLPKDLREKKGKEKKKLAVFHSGRHARTYIDTYRHSETDGRTCFHRLSSALFVVIVRRSHASKHSVVELLIRRWWGVGGGGGGGRAVGFSP